MDPTDAIDLINWFPTAGTVNGRGGSVIKRRQGTSRARHPGCLHKRHSVTDDRRHGRQSLHRRAHHRRIHVDWQRGFTSNQWQTGHSSTISWYWLPAWIFPKSGTEPHLPASLRASRERGHLRLPFSRLRGGTPAAGVHAYRVVLLFGANQTAPSAEITITNTGSTSVNTITIPAVLLSTGAKVYGRTAGGGTADVKRLARAY